MDTNTKYIKVSSYEGKVGELKKIVLLYSGGLDTSVMLKWIQEQYKAKVVTLTLDIGQQKDDLEKIRQKALKFGAVKAIVLDAKNEFANQILSVGIKANASYQGSYHLSTPMGRVITAAKAVEVCEMEKADAFAHGCTGKGNDQVRFESYALTLNPKIKVVAPVREWDMDRTEEIKYAQKYGIPVPASLDFPYSVDDNMWGMTWEGGEVEEPDQIPKIEKFLTTYTLPKNAPDKEEYVKIEFKNGLPIAVNGKKSTLAKIISQLNQIGGKHGVGIVRMFEDRLVGVKNGGVYEQPAAEIIITAHKALEQYISTRRLNELKNMLDIKWGYLCYGSLWFDPSIAAINAFNDEVNKKVTGEVTIKLYKGQAMMVAMKSPFGLDHTSFNNYGGYPFNVNASAGFTEIFSLQMKIAHQLNIKK